MHKKLSRVIVTFLTVFLFILGSYFLLHPKNADAAWYNSSWSFRKKLVIDESKVSGSSDLTNFPVLVSRLDDDLRAYAQTDADDILFTSSDGSTKLDHEIEKYDSSTGELIAWVRIPTLDYNDDTTIFMYYGNSAASTQQNVTATWNSNYKAIWHLKEDPSTTCNTTREVCDSTSNAYHADAAGSMNTADRVSGKIGYSLDFDGVDDTVSISNFPASTTFLGETGSVSFWFNESTLQSYTGFLGFEGNNPLLYLGQTGGLQAYNAGAGDYSSGDNSFTNNTWHEATFVWNSNVIYVYIDGALSSTDSSWETTFSRSTGTLYLAAYNWGSASNFFTGKLDEIRLNTSVLTADWIATEYANQNSPSTFFRSVSAAQGSSQVIPDVLYRMDEGYGTTLNSAGTNNYSGVISGAIWRTEDLCVMNKCLYFDGSNDVITTAGVTSGVKSVAFWVKPLTTSEQFIDLNGSAYIQTSSGTISATGFTSPTIYVNGRISSTLAANRWQFVVVTTGTGISASALKLGQISTNYGQMFMDEFQLYSTQLSQSQIQSLYNSRDGNMAAVSLGSNSQVNLSDGLVGYWPMDENTGTSTTDRSGNGVTGTLANGATWATGMYGSAASFDGGAGPNADVIDLGDQSGYEISTFTISGWIYRAGTCQFSNCPVFSKGMTGNIGYSLEVVDSGGYKLRLSLRDGLQEVTGTTTINTNAWYHVTGTVDGQNVRVYVNGVLEAEAAQTQTPTFGGESAKIGNRNSGTDITLNGRLDDIRFYNRALTASEVRKLYAFAPGPIGYWKLDEHTGSTAYDVSTSGLPGTLYNQAKWSAGKFGGGTYFDGTGDYISAADNSIFDLTNQITIEAWARYTGSQYNNGGTVVSRGSGNSNVHHFYISKPNGFDIWDFSLTNSTGTEAYLTGPSMSYNQWYHLAGTWNGSTVKFYVNGVLVDTDTLSGSFANTANPFLIGSGESFTDPSVFSYEGSVDDVRLYNYPRTATQIIQDMNANHPLVGTPVSGSVGYWKFDEGYGTTAQDSTPNDNDLTLSAAAWTNSGKFNKAWDGNGARWLSRADDSDYDFVASDDFAISLWAKSDGSSNPATREIILNKVDTSTSNLGYAMSFENTGAVRFAINDDTDVSVESISTTADMYDGLWHYYTFVKQNTSSISLYVDGRLIAQDNSLSENGSLANDGALIVADNDAVNNLGEFTGDIDELKIYRAVMYLSDIQTEYNTGKAVVMGALSTESDGITASRSSSREYCVPGDTGTCNPVFQEWQFDENTGSTVSDSTGNSSLTINGNPVWSRGKLGSSLRFDGTGDYLSGTANTTNNSNVTVTAWVRQTGEDSNGVNIISYRGDSYGLFEDGGTTGMSGYFHYGAGQYDQIDSNIDLNDSTWHYVAYVIDDTNNIQSIYIDGDLMNSSATMDSISYINSSVSIGRYNSTTEFIGNIDRVQIFDFAMSSAQVAWNYDRGGAAGHWTFDETSGTTVYDSSGNNTHGNLVGSPTRTTSGKYNGALTFDGSTDQYAYLADYDAFGMPYGGSVTNESWSIAAWIKVNSSSGGPYPIISRTAGGQDVFNLVIDNAGKLILSVNDGTATVTGTTDLRSGGTRWYHVLGSWDNRANALSVYVDGNMESTTTYNSNFNYDFQPMIAGCMSTDCWYLFNGVIDDVRFYTYALNRTQIKTLMNNNSAIEFVQ
ncbi:DUF2341 domain-containing protein [candidate division WWE3 bacterium]|nr:DUF2341 domain-containing protein [candidate division WWE3 bacterium]